MAGLGALTAKINELLKAQSEAKRKTVAKKAMSSANKQYKSYRKSMLTAVKKQNKEIKRKQLSKIRRLPSDQREKAREALKAHLKKRIEQVNQRLPKKIEDAQHLKRVLAETKDLRV